MATQNSSKIGKTKKSTDNLIDDAVASQQSWLERRRAFAKRFFKSLNVFAKPAQKKTVGRPAVKSVNKTTEKSTARQPWFIILCVFIVVFVTIWTLWRHIQSYDNSANVATTDAQTVQTTDSDNNNGQQNTQSEQKLIENPAFGDVRMGNNGAVVITGKWRPNTGVSVFMNDKLIATTMADKNGDFVYRIPNELDSGNYTFYLMDADSKTKSNSNVFVYVSNPGVTHSELVFPKHKLRVNVQTVNK